jgi:hypothetical protein
MDDGLGWLRAVTAPPRRSIVELIGGGVLDIELAGLAWALLGARIPLIVAGLAQGAGKTTLFEALFDFLPPTVRRIDLAGVEEDFGWLPEAAALGWQPAAPAAAARPVAAAAAVTPASAYLVAAELSPHLPLYSWGTAARTLVRAASLGYGIGATIHADRLEEVHEQLRSPSVGLTDDELSYLGLVIVIRAERGPDGQARRRVVAAHYARPVGRDEHGHVQRLGPAVVAVRDARTDRLEHFAWGVMPEIAARLGRTAGELEEDVASRAALLGQLVADGVVDLDSVRTAIAGHRPAGSPQPPLH